MDSIVIDLLKQQEERLKNIESKISSGKTILAMDDLSTLTGLSKSHLYKLTCKGMIPHYKQSRHVFFDRQEIEQWLKSNPAKTAEQIDRESSSYVMTNREGGAR